MNATKLVEDARLVLLDFDGPICAVFSGLPAAEIATRLRAVIRDAGHAIPQELETETDPLRVLAVAANLNGDLLVRHVEDSLRAAELAAVQTSSPTPTTPRFMRQVADSGRPLAIVSNNSEPAVARYLELHGLRQLVATIVGRPYGRPDRMKPNVWLLEQASAATHVPLSEAVLIGDSVTDIQAAQRVGAQSVGFANRPEKTSTLADAGADAVITTMRALCAD